jgi:hypothetical protein
MSFDSENRRFLGRRVKGILSLILKFFLLKRRWYTFLCNIVRTKIINLLNKLDKRADVKVDKKIGAPCIYDMG